MRLGRLLGVAAITSLVAMAVIGAGTASATKTRLCKVVPNAEGKCLPAAEILPKATLSGVLASDSPAKTNKGILFTTGIGNVFCTESTFTAEVEEKQPPGEILVVGKLTSMTFGKNSGTENCTSEVTFCPKIVKLVTTAQAGVEAIHTTVGTTGPNGVAVIAAPSVAVTLKCKVGGGSEFEEKCAYGKGEMDTIISDVFNPNTTNEPTNNSGNKAVLHFNETVVKSEGGTFCPANVTAAATYVVTREGGANVYLAEE